MFSYVTLEQRVPGDHPLWEIRRLTDVVLRSLSEEFDSLYSASGRPSIAPEYVLRALLLQAFYSVRSERQLVEQLNYNLLFRWFVGFGMDDAAWNHAVFSKNRDRLLTSEVAQQFFAAVVQQSKRLMSDEHLTVDGTLIQAWASQKSFRRKDGSDDGDGANFHGQKRSNKTHQSTTDPESRLYKKSYGKESKLAYLGHALVEKRNGLIAAAMATQADGFAERDAALLMLEEKQKDRSRRITVGAMLNSLGPFSNLSAYAGTVETGGANDIKDLPGHSPQNPIDVDAGNISYGITCPFGQGVCQFFAGLAQTLALNPNFKGSLRTGFDTPSDNAQIRVGQAMRAAGCHE